MSKPSYLGANVEVESDTFASFINKVNLVIDDMAKTVVTVAPVDEANTTNGALSVGNAHIQGVLSADTGVFDEIRGGTMGVPATMIVSSNVVPKSNTAINIGNTTNRVAKITSNDIDTANLTANVAEIKTANVNSLTANTASATTANVNSLTANVAEIKTANVNSLTANTASATTANVNSLTANTADIKTATVGDITANTASVTTANVNSLTANTASVTTANVNSLTANTATIKTANVTSVTSNTINVTSNIGGTANLTANNATIKTANVNSFTANNVGVTTANVNSLTANSVTITTATVGDVTANNVGTNGNVVISGNLTVHGVTMLSSDEALAINTSVITNLTSLETAQMYGTVTVGNATSGSLVVNAKMASNLVPDSNTRNIGSSTGRFANVYANTWNGALTVSGNEITINGASPTVRLKDTDASAIDFFIQANGNEFIVMSDTDSNGTADAVYPLRLTPSANTGYMFGNKVWTDGNDGDASGLDADLLDGQHGSYYLAAAAYNASDVLTKLKTVDGAGSGFDADLLDGQHGDYYRDLANSTGTLPNARISGSYDGITNFGMTGVLSITNNVPIINMFDTTANAYAGQLRVDNNNLNIFGSSDGVTFTEVARFELDTNTGYIGSQKIWTAGNDGASSGLDADLLDGQHGTYYRDLANSTGTLPNARLSGLYDGFTFSTTSAKITGSNWNSALSVEGTAPSIYFKQTDANPSAYIGINGGAFYILNDADGNGVYESVNPFTLNLDGSGMTYGGSTVWTAGNDGSGSTLDADLLDGQHGTYYRDLANSTGTLPNARLSGAYSGITTLSTTGLLTISNAAEALRLSGPAAADDPFMSFYAGGVRTAYIQHTDGTGTGAGFRLFNDVTDDYLYLSNVNSIDALKFYDSSTATHETVLTTGNLSSARVTGALGFTPASNAISITAGNGLTGGGTLGASRTLAVGQGTGITVDATTVSVDSTVWRDGNLPSASQITGIIGTVAEVYTGSSRDNTNFPVGHTIIAKVDGAAYRNQSSNVILSGTTEYSVNSTGTALSGTWRARGSASFSGSTGTVVQFQRTA